MSTQGYRDNRFPFVLTGHLVMAGQGLWTPRQLLLSMSMHACNRATLFCGERRKTDEDHEETQQNETIVNRFPLSSKSTKKTHHDSFELLLETKVILFCEDVERR